MLRPDVHAVARHAVVSAGSKSGIALSDDERLTREVHRYIRDILVVIVESYDVQCSASEEMIVRRRLVASCSDRS